MSFTVIIADDESLVRKSVRRFLRDYDAEVLEECSDGAATLAALRARKPDILFLDMEMPGLKGMQVMERIGENNLPTTIVLTAHENYALQAYDFNVADYILKPFGRERFERGLARAISRTHIVSSHAAAPGASPTAGLFDQARRRDYPEHIPVPGRHGRISLIRSSEIEWVEAEENILMIHAGDRVYELRETLSDFQARLNPDSFCRIHRSTVVNVHFIREVHPWRNGHHVVVLKSGHELRMSRYQHESVERLTNLSMRDAKKTA
jgi:two-component system LytT family response regulator